MIYPVKIDIEIQKKELNQISEKLSSINTDLAYLSNLKNDLVYNIDFLKTPEINVILEEYKRSIKELDKVREIIGNINKKQAELKSQLNLKFQEYMDSIDSVKNYTNNIIEFKRKTC